MMVKNVERGHIEGQALVDGASTRFTASLMAKFMKAICAHAQQVYLGRCVGRAGGKGRSNALDYRYLPTQRCCGERLQKLGMRADADILDKTAGDGIPLAVVKAICGIWHALELARS